MNERRRQLVVVNERGLHARASAKFVNAVSELPDSIVVKVGRNGTEASGGSILGLMMLGAARGDTIEIIVSGEGSEAIFEHLCAMVEDGFGET